MFDLGTLTLPALALLAVLGAGIYTGDDVTMGDFSVTSTAEEAGYNADVVTRRLRDHMAMITDDAAAEMAEVSIEPTSFERSVSNAQTYFELRPAVDAARLALGTMPFFLNGEITARGDQLTLTVRVFSGNARDPVTIVEERGTADALESMIHDAAVGVLEQVSPFVAGVYTRSLEEANGEITFPRTILVAERMLAAPHDDQHYLACALLARTLMRRAELATTDPSFDQRKADYEEALRYFDLALMHRPGFTYALINKGVIQAVLGDYAAADATFAAAVRTDPNRLLTRVRWAEMLLQQGRPEQAVYQYVAAVSIAPHDAALRAQLGDIYSQLGAQDLAVQQYEMATFLDPANDSYRKTDETLTGTKE
jgi:tetratricopeptide (TPR) repeat protein